MKRLYFLINKDIQMSKAKTAVQVAHCMTEFALKNSDTQEFIDWYANGKEQVKIVLEAPQSLLEKYESEHISIRDNGYTELNPYTLTCVCLGLLEKEDNKIRYLPSLRG